VKFAAIAIIVQQLAQPRAGQSRVFCHGGIAKMKRAAAAAL
jgi:hypothetical protein